jgi:hypothetical protein
LNSEMIWKIWKTSRLNSEKIWKLWKKSKLKCEKIWKIWKISVSHNYTQRDLLLLPPPHPISRKDICFWKLVYVTIKLVNCFYSMSSIIFLYNVGPILHLSASPSIEG